MGFETFVVKVLMKSEFVFVDVMPVFIQKKCCKLIQKWVPPSPTPSKG